MVVLYLIAIAIITLLLLATIGTALFYFGVFESIEVSSGPTPYRFGGRKIAYKIGKGKCSDSSAIFTEICSILPTKSTIGLYCEENKLDSNETTHQETFDPLNGEFVYLVGAFVDDDDDDDENEKEKNNSSKLSESSPLNENELQLLERKGYRFIHLPPASDNFVFSKFPFRGILSVVIAIRRVYPAISQYIMQHRLCAYPAIEIYDRDTIYFLFPLSHQSEFVSLLSERYRNLDNDDLQVEQQEKDDEEESTSSSTESFDSHSSFEKIGDEAVLG